MFKRILYTSFVDISIPYGPGVNELVFIKDLFRRYRDNLHVVIPRPSRGMPAELAALGSTYLTVAGSSRTVFGWLQARTLGALSLWSATRRFDPDLIVMRSGSMAIPQLMVTLQKKVPYVIKTAGDGSHSRFYARNPVSGSLKFIDQIIHRRILARSSCIDLVSESQRKNMTRLFPDLDDRIHVIDNGVDASFFEIEDSSASRNSMGFGEDEIVVGYVGNFPMRRGGKEVVDVVAALATSAPVRGLIVGDSGEAEACRRHAEACGVSDRVLVYGEADYSDLPFLMIVIDCGLSILRQQERGASEQKVRQYLAAAACVVGTAGSNDFLRDYDFARVVETDQPAEVIAAVESLIAGGRSRLVKLGQKARKYASQELTISARNDIRLQYWAAHTGKG
jgi:glycosyltransferase involved in cell wall biosynthesis